MTAVLESVSVETSEFAEAVSAVAPFASSNNVMPILQHVRIEARNGEMRLSAWSRESYAERTIECGGDCDLLLPAKTLMGAAKGLPSLGATIDPDGRGGAVLVSGRSKFRLPGLLETDDFLPPPRWDESTTTAINRDLFSKLVKAPLLAAEDADKSGALACVKVWRDGDDLRAVATNRERLNVSRVHAPGGPMDALIPSGLATAVSKLPSADIEIGRSTNGMWVARCRNACVAFVGGAGAFPETWERIVPIDPPVRARFSRALFSEALRRMLGTMSSIRVVLGMDEDGGISLLFPDGDNGQRAEDFVPAESGIGGGTVGFNPRYVLDALNALDGDEVEVCYHEVRKASVFKTNDETLCVIAQMAVD